VMRKEKEGRNSTFGGWDETLSHFPSTSLISISVFLAGFSLSIPALNPKPYRISVHKAHFSLSFFVVSSLTTDFITHKHLLPQPRLSSQFHVSWDNYLLGPPLWWCFKGETDPAAGLLTLAYGSFEYICVAPNTDLFNIYLLNEYMNE
jgi:hypothetical protein